MENAPRNALMRDKYWSEIGDTGKIERLRVELKRSQSVVRTLQKQVNDLLSHRHDTWGLTVKPLALNEHGYEEVAVFSPTASADDVYF